jgi:hypothetical protein
MLTESERMITAWLGHATHGVNAIAAQIPRDKIGGGTYPAPPTVALYCAADSKKVRVSMEPESAPALVIRALLAPDEPAKGYRPSGEIPIAVFFMVDEKADDQTASDAATYILRAAKLSLARFNSERLAGSARTLNDIRITKIVRTTEHRIPESNGRYKTPAFLEVIVAATDGFGSPTPATLGAFQAAG